MGYFFDQIPERIQSHIREITKTSGMPDNEESLEKISEGWLEKKRIFEEQIEDSQMEEIESFSKDDDRGLLALTYSGSIVNVGPLSEDARRLEYSSIGLRLDVPDSVIEEVTDLAGDVETGGSIEFESGRLRSTSPIFKITVCEEGLDAEEQIKTLANITQILLDEFINVNKTVIMEEE
ncbi:unnamed protein product [marine sediment metagenome]|uniref:Uncharacterized protein n=1 Tax=marine sediment metagenome TaxID=412755 RepID=X0V6Z6_9ZZZZ